MVIPQRLHGKDNNTLKQKQLSYAIHTYTMVLVHVDYMPLDLCKTPR